MELGCCIVVWSQHDGFGLLALWVLAARVRCILQAEELVR